MADEKTTNEPPYVRLIQYAELLLALGRPSEAAKWAQKAREMICAQRGVKDEAAA